MGSRDAQAHPWDDSGGSDTGGRVGTWQLVALGLPGGCLAVGMNWWDRCGLAGLEMNFASEGINN